jgi:hypothetical protein
MQAKDGLEGDFDADMLDPEWSGEDAVKPDAVPNIDLVGAEVTSYQYQVGCSLFDHWIVLPTGRRRGTLEVHHQITRSEPLVWDTAAYFTAGMEGKCNSRALRRRFFPATIRRRRHCRTELGHLVIQLCCLPHVDGLFPQVIKQTEEQKAALILHDGLTFREQAPITVFHNYPFRVCYHPFDPHF